MTSPHQDAAGLISRLRECARDCIRMEDLHDAEFFNSAASLIEQQAKALSEAEADVERWKREHAASEVNFQRTLDRALAAEARLAEAMKVIEPFADVVLPWGDIGSGMIDAKSVLAARSFLNSDSK